MKVILYHQDGCPTCRMVDTLLKQNKIEYESCKDINYMTSIGIKHTPVLEVDGTRLVGKDIIMWIKRKPDNGE